MDGDTFANLVKRLMQARMTRVEALRGLLASAAVGLTGTTLAGAAEATKPGKQSRAKGKAAKQGKQATGKAPAQPTCRDAGHPCEGHQQCCAGLVCVRSGPGNARRCAAPPGNPPGCPPSAPNLCPSSDQCLPACTDGGVFDPGTCACVCPPMSCCSCIGGDHPFCGLNYPSAEACMGACDDRNPNWAGRSFSPAVNGTSVCKSDLTCEVSCPA